MDLFLPRVAYAESFNEFLTNVTNEIINPLIGFMFALAVVIFLYGVLQFLMNAESEEAKTTGKQHMIWGIIGIAIMMSVWTILSVVSNTVGTDDEIKLNPAQIDLKPAPQYKID